MPSSCALPGESILTFEADWHETLLREREGAKGNVLAVDFNSFQLQSFYWKSAVRRKVLMILIFFFIQKPQKYSNPV
jgi:hypothetical protein